MIEIYMHESDMSNCHECRFKYIDVNANFMCDLTHKRTPDVLCPLRSLEEHDKKVAKMILTDIQKYLENIADEWLNMKDERKYELANIQVYNHVRKELDDLEEYKKKYGIEVDE